MKRTVAALSLVGLLAFGTLTPSQASSPSTSSLWTRVDEQTLALDRSTLEAAPKAFAVFRLDDLELRRVLSGAPLEFTGASGTVLALPMPDGSTRRFRVVESPIMEAPLAARFPEIKTFSGQGVDDPTATVRFDRTPQGFHATLLTIGGAVSVHPFAPGGAGAYVSYFFEDARWENGRMSCETTGEAGWDSGDKGVERAPNGATLRTYRLAVAATAEYTQAFGGGTVSGGLSAVTTTINGVNAVYERELAVRLTLVGNESSIIFTNPATDGYTSDNINALVNENPTRLDQIIGNGGYDIGHVFDGRLIAPGSFSFQGFAFFGVCNAANKGRAASIFRSVQPGDPLATYNASHEMGHQFFANHTFNGTTGACGSARIPSKAYEPGSGSTIMAYRFACGAEDFQSGDLYFHTASFEEITTAFTASGTGACAQQTATGNTPPSVDAGPSFTIPRSTPFVLTAAAGDPNGDALTYCWEEFDLGTASPPNTDDGTRPIFRSFAPTTNPSRTLPRLSDVLNNTTTFGESLPTTTRTMNFRCTVRDNRAGGGGADFDVMQVNVTSGSGPFIVTQPNTAVVWTGGQPQTVTWNPAGTAGAPVNCANVRIRLSTDGGNTFPYILAHSTPNDGSQVVTATNVPTGTARVRVEGVGNIFFDVSNANFTIQQGAIGTDTVGIYLPQSGAWFLKNSNSSGDANLVFGYGPPALGWIPIKGDWNGDGVDTPGLYDPVSGFFFLKDTNAPGDADYVFGFGPPNVGWRPIAGDWNGDGRDTVGLFDPVSSFFFLRNENLAGNADLVFGFGPAGSGWQPIAGDFDGIGGDSVGLYDPVSGFFFLKFTNSSGNADTFFGFGPPNVGWRPLAADWDGDGDDTVGLYDPASGFFFLKFTNSSGNADTFFGYGAPGATPIAGDWNGA